MQKLYTDLVDRESPFLTVGIASYNYEKYLYKSFEQIKKQKFNDFELLYCDDGSTDNSANIIEGFILDNPQMNIRLIKGSHEGLLQNKNRIIDNARGKYILICDADDYMKEDALQLLCENAMQTSADCIFGGFEEVLDNGKVISKHIPSNKTSKWLQIWHHAQIYKRNIIVDNNIRFDSLPDDVCFLHTMHLYAHSISYVPQSIYVWVRHKDSCSISADFDSEWANVNIWNKLVHRMSDIVVQVSEQDKKCIYYFLYKWFYLNVMDSYILGKKNYYKAYKSMNEDMMNIIPNYRKLGTFFSSCKCYDTLKAKILVCLCWVFDKCFLWRLLVAIRKMLSYFFI